MLPLRGAAISPALAHEPHRVAFCLYDLASVFHVHWNKGKELPHLRFIRPEDEDISRADDRVDIGFLKAQSNIHRIRQVMLGFSTW